MLALVLFMTMALPSWVPSSYHKTCLVATIVQYANNGLAHNMVDMGGGWYDSWNDADSASGFRIMNTGEIPVTDDFRFTHALTYGYASDIGATVDDEDLISAVARVTFEASHRLTTGDSPGPENGFLTK